RFAPCTRRGCASRRRCSRITPPAFSSGGSSTRCPTSGGSYPFDPVLTVNFAIKAEVRDVQARTFVFPTQKTMYGGKRIAEGDTIYVFASENEGGPGLIAIGVVTSAKAIPKKRGIARQ